MPYDEAHAIASSILTQLQSAVDVNDAGALGDLFDDAAILVGTAGHSHGRTAVGEYLRGVLAQPASLRWDWRDVIVFHESPGAVGFASFGDIVVVDRDGEQRAPMRLTAFAVNLSGRWKLQQFHGSIPSDF